MWVSGYNPDGFLCKGTDLGTMRLLQSVSQCLGGCQAAGVPGGLVWPTVSAHAVSSKNEERMGASYDQCTRT